MTSDVGRTNIRIALALSRSKSRCPINIGEAVMVALGLAVASFVFFMMFRAAFSEVW